MTKNIRVALASNPNVGKSTIFNALTGIRQQVGNWPGVTVEKKSGFARFGRDRTAAFLALYTLTKKGEQLARNRGSSPTSPR